MLKFFRSWPLLGVVAGCLFTNAAASAYVIDDFSEGAFDLVVDSSTTSAPIVTTGTTDHILGGQREVTLTFLGSSAAGGVGEATAQASSLTGNTLNYAADAGVSASVLLEYGNGSLGADLLSGDQAAFLMDLVLVDGQLDMAFTVNGVTVNRSTSAAGPLLVHYSDFTGVDFSNVNSLSIEFLGSSGARDFIVDSITTTVPEPASLTLIGLGTLAMIRRRR